MEKNDTSTPKKAYAPPTVTRHGDVVEKTLGAAPGGWEYWNWGSPDWH